LQPENLEFCDRLADDRDLLSKGYSLATPRTY